MDIQTIKKILWRMYNLKLLKWMKSVQYRMRLPKILNEIYKKDRLRIIFFLPNLGMWKYETLFSLLLADDYFEPYLVPFPHPWHSKDEQMMFFEDIWCYCQSKGFPVINGYDIQSGTYMSSKELNPDIVVYTQPYNTGYDFWKIEKFWNKAIFIYTPYSVPIEDDTIFHFNLLQNISWKLFYPSPMLKPLFRTNLITWGGNNLEFVGNPLYDQFIQTTALGREWKIKDQSMKRIIWAPHHSILPDDYLHNSNFIEMADAMLALAIEYSDRVQFAFKPHPYLLEKLHKIWGTTRADAYYNKWRDLPNTALVVGDYVDLFLSSDGMIHDCASFMCDYLYVNKPVMFLCKDDTGENLNSYGAKCLSMHYKGNNIQDVRYFIEEVILNEADTMKKEREKKYKEYLLPPNGKSVGKNMYDILKSLQHGS